MPLLSDERARDDLVCRVFEEGLLSETLSHSFIPLDKGHFLHIFTHGLIFAPYRGSNCVLDPSFLLCEMLFRFDLVFLSSIREDLFEKVFDLFCLV